MATTAGAAVDSVSSGISFPCVRVGAGDVVVVAGSVVDSVACVIACVVVESSGTACATGVVSGPAFFTTVLLGDADNLTGLSVTSEATVSGFSSRIVLAEVVNSSCVVVGGAGLAVTSPTSSVVVQRSVGVWVIPGVNSASDTVVSVDEVVA